jgi:N-acetylglucosaminyldiphosphoundecaprenol N-acetyl-beta-D-mannosaminyltransferase
MTRRVTLLGFPLDLLSRDEAVARAAELVREGGARRAVALNPLKLMRARRDPALAESIRRADLVLADGVGIAWAARRLVGERPEVVPGCELMEALLAAAAREGWSVYFLGASPAVNEAMRRDAVFRFPGLVVAGARHGGFGTGEEEEVARAVVAAAPRILFVGMGAGRQEAIVERVARAGGGGLLMGVGGSFDAFTGALPRPPPAVRRAGFEWLWRALRQPSRIPRLFRLPPFVLLVLLAGRVSPNAGTMPRPCGKSPS